MGKLFEPGVCPNPSGRGKGNYGGRLKALHSLDKMMSKPENLERLECALEEDFLKNPIKFFKSIIMPLLPKESKLELDTDSVIRWQSLIGSSDQKAK